MVSFSSTRWFAIGGNLMRELTDVERQGLRHGDMRVFGRRFHGYDLLVYISSLPESGEVPYAIRVMVADGHRRGRLIGSTSALVNNSEDDRTIRNILGAEGSEKPVCGGLHPRIWMDE